MATTTAKTFTENYGSGSKSTWTIQLRQDNDYVVGLDDFSISPQIKMLAKYVGSNKGYMGLSANIDLIAGSGSNTFSWVYGTFIGLDEATSGKTYTIESSSFFGEIYIMNVFNSSNPTTIKVPVIARKTTDKSFRLETDNKSIAGSNYGRYDGETSVIDFGTVFYITLNAPPTFDTTQVVFTNAYDGEAYSGLTSASVTISNLSAKFGGNFQSGKAELIIGSQIATKNNPSNDDVLTINALNAVGSFTPVVRLTDSRGQVTETQLNPIEVKPYVAPQVGFTLERTLQNGDADENDGTYAVATASFDWTKVVADIAQPTVSVVDSDGNVETITASWYTDRELHNAVDWTDTSSFNSPVTLYAIIGTFAVNKSYQITITPKDNLDTYGTPKTQTLSSAFFTIDFLAGGHGIAFGQPSVGTGFVCDMEAVFNKDVTHDGDLYQNGESVFNDVATHYNRVYQKGETGSDIGFWAHNETNNYSLLFGIGSGGTNHGVYSYPVNKWLIFSDGTSVYANGTSTSNALELIKPNTSSTSNRNTADVTTTNSSTGAQVTSLSHTTNTGKYFIIAKCIYKTDKNTANIKVTCAGTQVAYEVTNARVDHTGVAFGVRTTTKGATETVALILTPQSGATATLTSYNTYAITCVDILN